MIELPSIDQVDFSGKRVIIRCDFDFGKSLASGMTRIESVLPTLDQVLKTASRVIMLAHRGRPGGQEDPNLSLEPLVEFLGNTLHQSVVFVPRPYVSQIFDNSLVDNRLILVENIRFWPEEEDANEDFALMFANGADAYVNEAFSVSHRKHVSLYTLPMVMQKQAKEVYFGTHFTKELEKLGQVLDNPSRPVVFFFGGLKEDKLTNIGELTQIADRLLVGGRLPEYVHDGSPLRQNPKIIVGNLTPDKEDLTINSIEAFEKEILSAKTLVFAGPAGKYEDEAHAAGTKRVIAAIVASGAFKVAAGGDTQEALSVFGVADKFDWVSVGGGATLEYLAKGTLASIEALKTQGNI